MDFELFTSVAEVWELRSLGFSERNIDILIEECREFDFKVKSNSRNVKDFQLYLKYLSNSLALLHKCQRRHPEAKLEDTKRAIILKYKQLCEEAMVYFPENFSIFLNHFKISSIISQTAAASSIDKMLRMHRKQEYAWLLGVTWYLEGMRNYGKASDLMVEALFELPSSQLLGKKAVALEASNEFAEEKLLGYLQIFFENITEMKFFIDILKLLQDRSFHGKLCKRIKDWLEREFWDDPSMWHGIAQNESSAAKKELVYKDGLTKLSNGKKSELLGFYLDEKLSQRTRISTETTNYFVENYVDYMSETNFRVWIQINECNHKKAMDIAYKGIEKHRKSVHLWKYYVHYSILNNEGKKEVHKRFRQGINALKEESVPLWEMFFTYLKLCIDPDSTVKKVYEEAIHRNDIVSIALMPKYLDWLYFTSGLAATENVYKQIEPSKFSKEIYNTMIRIYLTQVNCDLAKVENIYKRLCKEFKQDPKVWKEYIEFLRDIKESDDEEIKEAMHQASVALNIPNVDAWFIEPY